MGKLDGKVAIVTGGGRGIGRAVAESFVKEGALVVVTAARERREITSFAAQWGEDKALGLLADVADARACEGVAQAAIARFGRIDILVNNAARGMKYVSETFMTEPARFWETDPEVWKMVIDTNVNGPFFMARAVVPQMLRQKTGAIINVTMNYETMKRRGFSPYGPSKSALESETAIWAQDLEGSGITVNEILPGGPTDTGMIPAGTSAEMRSRLLRPEIMAPPAVYLASDQGRGITGRRITAIEWTEANPDGKPASQGIGG